MSHWYARRPVLKECSLTVPPGAVAALLGRNGAGKSTMLRAIAGLLRPDEGGVRLSDRPFDPEVLPRLGYVGQLTLRLPGPYLIVAGLITATATGYLRWPTGDAPPASGGLVLLSRGVGARAIR